MYSLIFYSLFFLYLFPHITAHSKPQKEEAQAEELVEHFNRLNSSGSPPKECQHCLQYSGAAEEPKEEALLQQCAVDLCGPAHENLRHIFNNNTLDNEDIDPEMAKSFDRMIRPSIEEALQAEQDQNKYILSILQDKLEDPESNIKPQEWDEIAEALSMKITMDNATTNTPAGFTNNNALTVNNYPSEIAHNGYTSYKTNKAKMMPLSVSSALFNLGPSSIERQRELLRERYENFLAGYQGNEAKFTKKDKRAITRLGEQLQPENKAFNTFAFADRLDLLIKKNKSIIFCTEEDCKKWVLDELTSLQQDLRENTSNEGQAQRLTQQLNHCQSVYNTNIQNERQMNIYKQNFNQYAGQFLIKAFKNYSSFSRQHYKNYMNTTLKVSFPPSERSVEERLVEDIREKSRYMTSYYSNKIAFRIQNREYLEDEYSVCPSPMETMSSSSFFSPEENMITLSHFSCTFHEHGKQILAHELAHSLSQWFGKNKQNSNKPNKPSRISYRRYMQLRRCANRRYKIKDQAKRKIPSRFRYYRGDKLRTEEDMADLIAYQVFQEDPTLLQCSSLLTSKDGSRYTFLHILPPPLMQQAQVEIMPDPHSTPLLRAITEAIHKRKELSPACQQVIDIYSDKINFEPCF